MAAKNQVQFQAGMSLMGFLDRYGSEEQCREALATAKGTTAKGTEAIKLHKRAGVKSSFVASNAELCGRKVRGHSSWPTGATVFN